MVAEPPEVETHLTAEPVMAAEIAARRADDRTVCGARGRCVVFSGRHRRKHRRDEHTETQPYELLFHTDLAACQWCKFGTSRQNNQQKKKKTTTPLRALPLFS